MPLPIPRGIQEPPEEPKNESLPTALPLPSLPMPSVLPQVHETVNEDDDEESYYDDEPAFVETHESDDEDGESEPVVSYESPDSVSDDDTDDDDEDYTYDSDTYGTDDDDIVDVSSDDSSDDSDDDFDLDEIIKQLEEDEAPIRPTSGFDVFDKDVLKPAQTAATDQLDGQDDDADDDDPDEEFDDEELDLDPFAKPNRKKLAEDLSDDESTDDEDDPDENPFEDEKNDESSDEERPKKGFLSKFKDGDPKSRFEKFKNQVAAEMKGDGDEDDEHAEERGKKGSGEGGEKGNPITRAYMKVADLFYKVLMGFLQLLTKIPLIGKAFKKLLVLEKPIRIVSNILPGLLIVLLLIMFNRSIAKNEAISLPDNGSVTFSDVEYSDSVITAKVENTGEVIVKGRPEFAIYSSKAINPISWVKPSKSVTCSGKPFTLGISKSTTVKVKCAKEPSGFGVRALGDLK